MKRGLLFPIICTFLLILLVGKVLAETSIENKVEIFLSQNNYVAEEESTNSVTQDGINIKTIPIKKIQSSVLSATNTDTDLSESSLFILEKNGEEKYFIAESLKQGDTNLLKMYNEEGGVVLDITNQKIVSTYGNEKDCGYWGCVGNYVLYKLKDPKLWICGVTCSVDLTGIGCLTCLGVAVAPGLWDCAWDKCKWYRCKKDCAKKFGLGEYINYCYEDNVWKQRNLFQYECPADIDYGESGDCEINYNNGRLVNQSKLMSCQYGCENSVCKVSPVCNIISPINNLTSQSRSILFKFESLDKLKNIQIIDHSDKKPILRKLCTNCKKDYSKKKVFKDGVHNLTITCTDFSGNKQEQSLTFEVNYQK